MYNYDHKKMATLLGELLQRHLEPEQWAWASEQVQVGSRLNSAFGLAPRKTGRHTIRLDNTDCQSLDTARSGFYPAGWDTSRLFRVWLLQQLPATSVTAYRESISRLFRTAEMNELVALYSALPLLAYPEEWRLQCAEGIRSNIMDVLRAIICNNPYPAEQLDEGAWNQLVLKAFFVGLPPDEMMGLEERLNGNLVDTLQDYVDERRAAGRSVHPRIPELIATFSGRHHQAY